MTELYNLLYKIFAGIYDNETTAVNAQVQITGSDVNKDSKSLTSRPRPG